MVQVGLSCPHAAAVGDGHYCIVPVDHINEDGIQTCSNAQCSNQNYQYA